MDVLTAILHRRSVRSYSSRSIAPATLRRLRESLRAAPSAKNLQPYHFIFVTEANLRQSLARAACEQLWMAEAPVTVVGVGLIERAFGAMGGWFSSVEVDVAIALDHLMLAAVAEELGTCWIGAFDEPTVKKLLAVPAGARVIAMTPLGYPASRDLIFPLDLRNRTPECKLFSEEQHYSLGQEDI